ncbi:hypothetical protein F2Q69_00024298 [Brassica cretica]|uniref:Uncharacterized protein n=1 Tax=Brassica cretica TaxID=69181 RepID=A0A8S9QAA0_BRACR|nr:hypothetical protein F2Q69_00024298 [Brassica cretica]
MKLGPTPLVVAARWTLILLDVLNPCWCYLHTLPMEPVLTELIGCIALTTCPTLCSAFENLRWKVQKRDKRI